MNRPLSLTAWIWLMTIVLVVAFMSTILKSPVDLLWFGGIGTYVRGSGETDAEVGDRANDAIRITAEEVRARVIGEGANLGVTQKGRIGFSLNGGRCNSDAIDNSAGVNSSDVEVNIKIALASAMEIAPASVAVIVIVRVSRYWIWASSCAITPATSS